MRKYDIGVVGCWYWGNYGSLLNGYATNYLLKSFGLKPLNIVTPNNGFEPHAKKFFEAIYTQDDISPLLPFDRVNEFNDMCEMFLTGSDQIWNFKAQGNLAYDSFFRLNFVADDRKKVSFATSLGKYNREPERIYRLFQHLYDRYDAISVRETEAVDIMRKIYGIKATHVIEPVFDIPKDCWNILAERSEYNNDHSYLLTYILDPTPQKREAIIYYAQKSGLKIVNILDGFSGRYQVNKDKLSLPGTLPNICCMDFLKFFKNADYIITDSFHGVCFSLIFNKPFLAISNYERGVSRFTSLLNLVNMSERLVSDKAIPLDESYLLPLDFSASNTLIGEQRNFASSWLKDSITQSAPSQIKSKRHINISIPEAKCMGCGACVSSCPVNAIYFSEDIYGVYRAKVDSEKCINCGHCKEVCAAFYLPYNLNTSSPLSYAFIASDKELVMNSSSGGAFSVLAYSILENGGYVIGSAWSNDFTTKHIIIDNIDDLPKLQKSKYFQSYMGPIMAEIKQLLTNGKTVLFCGTPCQVAGLKKFLNRSYNNLYLIDLLCANCPSAGIFKQYLSENFSEEDLKSYDFRYKCPSDSIWDAKKIKIKSSNDKEQIRSIDNDPYLQVYHTCSWSLSSQCLSCNYQGITRYGDLTIGDCWGIEHFDKTVDVSKGVSVILVNNEKGKGLLDSIPRSRISLLKQEPIEEIKKYNGLAFIDFRNWPETEERQIFLDEYIKNGFNSAKRKVDSYISSFTPPKVSGVTLEKSINHSLILRWEKNVSAEGYIIEQYENGVWKRINRIGNNNITSMIITLPKQPLFNYKFRIKAFNFYRQKPLYSIYTEISTHLML